MSRDEQVAACTCARLSGDPGSYPCPVHPELGAATFAGPVHRDDAVLGCCPHGVDLDRDFCPKGCRV